MIQREKAIALASELYKALAGGDRPRIKELLHPEFTAQVTEGLPFKLGGRYSDPDNMLKDFWGKIAKNFLAKAEPAHFNLLDDGRLYVSGRYVGEARSTGKALDAEFVHVVTFASGQILSLHQLTDSERWVEAAKGVDTDLSTIEFSIHEGLATIRLNRPDVNNALNEQMAYELNEVATRCANESNLRAVLLLGNGKSFTVGGDISVFGEAAPAELPGLLSRMTGAYHNALRIFSRLNAPIVAGVHGAVAGGGLGLLYCADIVLAAEDTKFATGFSALGLSMDGGNSWYLPRLVGARRAAELYFEQRVLNAQEALEWGLLNRIVSASALEEQAISTARRLASGPTHAFAQTRQLFRQSWSSTLSEQLSAETDALFSSASSMDAKTAIKSFLTKTKPSFKGV